ncbi:hypothetical protein [Chitinimonas koreensis]|uniref:hypothetical protein n=1 Tax=Chitinimonas koreensis TaxID=356302 RepID=UPI000405A943|nr:hypothetical protein [Chitinimonas koreensis]QNM97381.1 hypothetical protein H9L41_03435 [Chitinimonas koreensis]
MRKPLRLWPLLPLAALFAGFVYSVERLPVYPRERTQAALSVTLPRPVQVMLSGGDRFLAANLATWIAVTIGTDHLDPLTAKALGRVQTDAAWLNPAHEDNYYIAAAVLPWAGQVEASQQVLGRAVDGRPADLYPPFFLGFNRQYFLGDYLGAARALEIAARRAPSLGQRNMLLDMAAKWSEREESPALAKATIKALAAQSPDPGLKQYLDLRIKRVETVQMLRDAARRFRLQSGRPLSRLEELVEAGLIDHIPQDPLDQGGFVVVNGTVVPKIQLQQKRVAQ